MRRRNNALHLDVLLYANQKSFWSMKNFARQNEYRRKEMMRDIRRINKELGITVLYVTNKRGETEIAGQK